MSQSSKGFQWLTLGGIVFSLVGIVVAAYLTYAHFTTPTVLACPASGIIDCAKVTSSSYAYFLGMPIALLGLVYFVVMLLVQVPAAWRSSHAVVGGLRFLLVAGGMVAVLWLLYAELFQINAICLYCSVLHILIFLLFCQTSLGMAMGIGRSKPTALE